MSGNLWMFSDKLDDEDIEIMKHEFITYYTVTEVRTDNGYTLLKDNIKIVISQVEATELCDIYSSDLLGLVQNDPRYAAIIKDTGNLKNMPQPHLEHHLLTASATVDSKNVNMLDDDGSANAICQSIMVLIQKLWISALAIFLAVLCRSAAKVRTPS